MSRILRFGKHRGERPRVIDAAKVWEYVLPRLGFPLPQFISREIDRIIGEMWNARGEEITFHRCVDALAELETRDILIPEARRERIVELIFEYLEARGFLFRLD
jgi:hypothetical protein